MDVANILSGDHRDLLDVIDNLRSQGFSRYVDLPEIIVCGDQSAGKSSVLEAISGLQFPAKDGLCTRFATELVLRREQESKTSVSITPGEGRFDEEKDKIERWKPLTSIEIDGLEAVTEEAMETMASPHRREFYDDILRIELTGPTQPHLTMVDLPGIFRARNKEQSSANAKIVKAMVEGYMARPRSIILAVVSAKNEFVLQDVTTMAEKFDPDRLRTIGLITKPDTVDVGSKSEQNWVNLAQNLDVQLQLGWHVLRNRNYEQRGSSSAERDAVEKRFFSSGIWSSIKPSHCGIAALRSRLSSTLKDQIIRQLPSLVDDVEEGIRNCTDSLDRLGPIRNTVEEQQRHLTQLIEEYASLMKQSVDGTYTSAFFGKHRRIDKYPRRLRAVVQNRLLEFSQEMSSNGQSRYIYDSDEENRGDEDDATQSTRISRSEYVKIVTQLLKYSKGRELPGLFRPLIVGDLFEEQSEPWHDITKHLLKDVVDSVHHTADLLVNHIVANDVAEEFLKLLHERIEILRVETAAKIDELLRSASQHAITYNPQLLKNVEEVQQDRQKRVIKKLISKTFSPDLTNGETKIKNNPIHLIDSLTANFRPNLEHSASLTAVDYMEAYYKVALDRFVDDVSVLAIEDCLIHKLPELFRPRDVMDMSREEISRLASESPESASERDHLVQKRKILEVGLPILKSSQNRRSAFVVSKIERVERGSLDFGPSAAVFIETKLSSDGRGAGVSESGSRAPSSLAYRMVEEVPAAPSTVEIESEDDPIPADSPRSRYLVS